MDSLRASMEALIREQDRTLDILMMQSKSLRIGHKRIVALCEELLAALEAKGEKDER